MNAFKVARTLGKGNYGQVVLATRRADGVSYAIKQIQTTQLNKTDREAQLQEIRVLASVFHPNVVLLYEAFIEFGKLYMVLEYCSCGDLNSEIRAHISERKPFTEARVWEVLLYCLAGLRELHHLGIIHRDMKPQNVLLCDAHIAKIGDLGFSVVVKQEKINESLGTPYYISPEVWKSEAYGAACDIFSLGVIIYYMLALKHPFEGKDILSLKRACISGAHAPLPATYSAELRELVEQMLIADQRRRPTAAQLLEMPACQQHAELSPTSLHQQILPDILVQEREFAEHIVPELAQTIPNDQAMQNAMRGLANMPVQPMQYTRIAKMNQMAQYESSRQMHTPSEQNAQQSQSVEPKEQKLPCAQETPQKSAATTKTYEKTVTVPQEHVEMHQDGIVVQPYYDELKRVETALEATVRAKTQHLSQIQYPRMNYPNAITNYPSAQGHPLKRFW